MKPSPLDIRARMVAGYLEGYRRAGLNPSVAEVEKQVIADCQLVDAARAAGDLTSSGKKAERKPGPVRPNVLAEAQHETNTRLGATGTPMRFRALHQNPQLVSERWGYAVARIGRILEGAAKTSSLVSAVENAELAQLATDYTDLYAHFMFRHAPPPPSGNDRNPFRGLSDKDASRKFMRLVEDICDRSTGRLGSWYTK